jgi:hypothetical protein
VDTNGVVTIIKRRQAKFQEQRRAGVQKDMDEAARLIAEEYVVLLAEIAASETEGSQLAEGPLKVHGDPLDHAK